MLMTSPIAETLQKGWKDLDAHHYQDAEHLFKHVIQSEADEKIDVMDLVDAHNGLGMVALAHKDLLDARRWFHEARYLLDQHYEHHWPDSLSWTDWRERVPLHTLLGSGHVEYLSNEIHKAKEYYDHMLKLDPSDGGQARHYLEAMAVGKPFKEE